MFAFREGAADRGDRVSLMIGERELGGTDQANLAKRLPGAFCRKPGFIAMDARHPGADQGPHRHRRHSANHPPERAFPI